MRGDDIVVIRWAATVCPHSAVWVWWPIWNYSVFTGY